MTEVQVDSALERAEERPLNSAVDEERRRGTRLWFFGAMLVTGIAKTWVDAPNALAGPFCCDLYYPNGPWCGGTQGNPYFSCPSGYVKRQWACCFPSGFILCWECCGGPTCWDGPFACSNWSNGASCG